MVVYQRIRFGKSDRLWFRSCDNRFILTTTFDYGRNIGCCERNYFLSALRNAAKGRKIILKGG